MHGKRQTRWCWLLIAWLAFGVAAVGAQSSPWAIELQKAGVEPDRKGIEKFLATLRLTPELEAKIKLLLVDLGDERFKVREKATADLLKLPPIAEHLLKDAAGRDLETQGRVKLILSKPHYAEAKQKALLVLHVIATDRIKGLAPLVLDLMPQWEDEYLLHAAAKAVEASVDNADDKALRQVIAKSKSEQARAAAVAAWATVFKRDVEKDLEELLKDKSAAVRLEAAIGLLNLANHKALPVLVELLETEKPEVRQSSASVLRAATGQEIAYATYDEAKKRAEAVKAWRAWVGKHGDTAKLVLPVRKQPLYRGRILVGVWSDKALREFDVATGQTTFEAGGYKYLWGCHATPEGHRLAIDFQDKCVVEYDSQGKECWRRNVPGSPTGVERLPNGRTLIAMSDGNEIIEMDRAGDVVWKVNVPGRPTTAQRLANGNILVCLQFGNKVVEIDPKGVVVWQLHNLNNPFTAQALENGNVLVCEYANGGLPGGAKEFDRQGKLVWSNTGKMINPAQAQRLPNGNTVISGENGVTEFDADNRVVRHLQVSRGRFFAY
ncbi:MAG TPA: PQQ-binding-like beta-propeller repeat protein [Gemmataceae bacterium]|nr:PQQ-binding-like beta-propeller repeat protein [Gemmataceae bacterium]